MKKNYQKPEMKAVKIKHHSQLLCGSLYEVIGTDEENATPS